jgi:Ricin-type beta-trefoil lectin domain
VGILRRVFVASCVVVVLAFMVSASPIYAHTFTRTAVARPATLHVPATSTSSGPKPATLKNPLSPSSPPHACTTANDGEVWIDSDNNEKWECFCFDKFRPDGQRVLVCAWALVLDQPNPSTWLNLNSGLNMDVEGVSKNNGARIHQWAYTGGRNQWWQMVSDPSFFRGTVLEAISVNSNKCVGVSAASKSQGAWIVQWSCNGSADQGWVWAWTGSFTSNGWPIWNLVNMNSNMCLGISAASKQQGAYAVQWACNGSPDQSWY